MNEKQKRFCEEYIIDHNATQAAIRAGYSPVSARQVSSRMMTNDDIMQKINDLKEAIPKKDTIASAEEVLEYLTSVMRGKVFDQAVKRDEYGKIQTMNVVAKVSDRNKAADTLAKHYALLVDKVEVTKPKTELAAQIEAVLHG